MKDFENIKKDLKDWRKILRKYRKKDVKSAIFQMITSFLPYFALWALTFYMFDVSITLFILLCAINAFFLVRIFIIQHDCGHESFFKSNTMNNIIGYFCSIFSFLPFKYWSTTHHFHHFHTGMLDHRTVGDLPTLTVKEYHEKSTWGKITYRVFRMPIVTFVIAPMYYFFVTTKFPFLMFGNKVKTIRNLSLDNVIIFSAYVGVGFLLGWKVFLLTQFTTLFFFGIIAFWFFYVQHQHEHNYKEWDGDWDFLMSAIKGSSYYKLPKLFTWLTGNIGYHHIHHLSSIIPNYNLVKCFKENPILTKYTNIITFKDSLKMISNKLWYEEQKRMISFIEYKYLKKNKALSV